MAPPLPVPVGLFMLWFTSAAAASNDTDSLIGLMWETNAHGNLRFNWTTSDACSGEWKGVGCTGGRVTSLSLPSMDLRGPINFLRFLDQLRHLDLHGNHLSGSLSPLSACTNLKFVYLLGNDFSGDIPEAVASSLTRLLRIDLSNNQLHGGIPSGFLTLSRLLTLKLHNNFLTGTIPHLSTTNLNELNLSNNRLYGEIPEALERKFGWASFSGNAGLCGHGLTPLARCSFTNQSSSPNVVVPSDPILMPPGGGSMGKVKTKRGLSRGTIIVIVVGNAVVFLLLVALLFTLWYCCCRTVKQGNKIVNMMEKSLGLRGQPGHSFNGYDRTPPELAETADRSNKLVFFVSRRKHFELEDLLRASAEMLGRGSLGTVYKAILEDGSVVAVKRLKEVHPCCRKEFEQHMEKIGRLRHPNLVRLRAYYYAKEEKLLIYDYIPNGTLFSLLHGNGGAERHWVPLDWTTRVWLALGAARGLAHIHEWAGMGHGNVKSSNILVNKKGMGCVSDFGLASLLLLKPPNSFASGRRLKAAPDQETYSRLSPKADVYGFGVVLLELLTGKAHEHKKMGQKPAGEGWDLPKWVQSVVREEWTAEVFDLELLTRYKDIEEELVAMLQIALGCVVPDPNSRPTMADVVRMIEDIRVEPLSDQERVMGLVTPRLPHLLPRTPAADRRN